MFGFLALVLASILLQEPASPVSEEGLQRTVRLVATTSRTPVAGVKVWIRGTGFRVDGQTDDAGKVVLRTPKAVARVGCEGEGIWCGVERMKLEQADVSLPVWKDTSVSGFLAVAPGDLLPKEIVVQAINPRANGLDALERRVTLTKGRYGFSVPPGLTDFRFAVSGFSPAYLWQVDLAQENHNLGTLRLSRGASISGTVVDPNTEKPASRILARLVPLGGAPGPSVRTIQMRTTSLGFFQLQNVPIGLHRILFLRGDRVVSGFGPIEVTEDAEIRLDKFLLKPLVSLRLALTPALTPDGERWRVRLGPESPVVQGVSTELENSASEIGEVEFKDLLPGLHRMVVTAGQQRVLMEKIDIESDASEARELPMVKIHGRVRLGSAPIAGALVFATGTMDRASFTSDQDGRFSGWMKRPGTNVFVSVNAASPKVAKNVVLPHSTFDDPEAEVDIRLDDVRVLGRVAFRGKPREGVVIKAQSSQTDFTSATSDRDGFFELRPLSAAPYLVTAYDKNFPRSRPIEFDGAHPPDRLDIDLTEGRTLKVQALLPDGSPVAGAQVKVDPIGFSSSFLYQATATSGALQIPIPSDASRLFVRVISPGVGAWSGCLTTPSTDTPLTVVLPGPPFAYGKIGDSEGNDDNVLVSSDGAAWSLEDLILWPRSLRSSDTLALGFPAGAYATLLVREPWERFIERWCGGGPGPGMTWFPIAIGGQSVIGSGIKSPKPASTPRD